MCTALSDIEARLTAKALIYSFMSLLCTTGEATSDINIVNYFLVCYCENDERKTTAVNGLVFHRFNLQVLVFLHLPLPTFTIKAECVLLANRMNKQHFTTITHQKVAYNIYFFILYQCDAQSYRTTRKGVFYSLKPLVFNTKTEVSITLTKCSKAVNFV